MPVALGLGLMYGNGRTMGRRAIHINFATSNSNGFAKGRKEYGRIKKSEQPL
jgi:hypothetical protein